MSTLQDWTGFFGPEVGAAAALALAGGALLWAGAEAGLYWIAAGVLMTLVAGVMNTWVLLVEILR